MKSNRIGFDGLAALYSPMGVRSAASGTAQGPQAIRAWYVDWLNNQLPGGSFTLGPISQVNLATWSFAWACHSTAGDQEGRESVGLQDGKPHYHATNLV